MCYATKNMQTVFSEQNESNVPTFPGLKVLGRRVIILLVFAIFPILVALTSITQVERLEAEKKAQARRIIHERILARIKAADNDADMGVRLLEKLLPRLQNGAPYGLGKFLKTFSGKFPGAADFFFFSPDGKLIREISSERFPRRAIERAFFCINERRAGRALSPGEEGLLKSMFAAAAYLDFPAGKRVIFLGKRDRDTNLIYDVFPPAVGNRLAGILILFHSGAIKPGHALRNAIRKINHLSSISRFGYVDLSPGRSRRFPRSLDRYTDLRASLVGAFSRYERHFTGTNFIGSSLMMREGYYLVGLAPIPGFFSQTFFRLFYALCGAWFFLVFLRMPIGKDGFSGRIPTKLVGLFLFALSIPFLLLLIGGFYALKDHANVMMESLENRIREKLIQFDERLPVEVTLLEGNLRTVMTRLRALRTTEDRIKMLEVLKSEKAIDFAYLIDERGRAIYSKKVGAKGGTDYALLLGREVLKRLNDNMNFDSGSLMVEATEGIFSSLLGEGKRFNLEVIMRDLGHFFQFSISDESSWIFVDAIYDEKGIAKSIFLCQVPRDKLERKYVDLNLRKLMQQPDITWRVAAVADTVYAGDVLPEPADISQTHALSREVCSKRSAAHAIIGTGDSERFWYGMRGQNILRYTLVANSSLTPLKEHINFLWLVLVAVAMMVVVSTGVIGLLLSEQFLAPIGDLTAGIKSIQERRFDVRIPIHARDELGEMANLLNHVIEGMQDLQVARIVQESLFPPEPVELGAYRIAGKSRAMTDIGGDYFDFFTLGNRRLMGLVGDVSGHGVSAALIMGMAKCAMTLDENPDKNLLDVISQFNRFLLRTIKRRKMMTLFLFGVDVNTHCFQFTNAGHNSPYIWRAAERSVEMFSLDSFPLGTRAKAVYELRETVLAPGDTVVFYTDGLVEATGADGAQLGYDRTRDWVRDCMHLEPEAIVDRLFSRFDRYTEGIEPNDDISIICLKRLA
ncbi:MAG: SpoIIE family protein phosphatase [Candidatus Ozemobacteraceae bacterium]